MANALPDLSRVNPLVDFARGLALPVRALGILFRTPALLGLTLSVVAITLVTLVALFVVLWRVNPAIVDLVWHRPEAWYLSPLHHLLSAFVFLLLFVLGANVLPLTLAAPLMDPISLGAERALGFPVVSPGGTVRMVAEVVKSVSHALVRVVVLLLGHALLLPLLLLPGIGTLAWTWLGWIWTVLWLAAQYLDVPMARHLYSFNEEAHVLRQRAALCFGFGAAIYLMMWVPLLNCFFVPVAVVGGTLLFRGMVATGLLPPPKDERVGSDAE